MRREFALKRGQNEEIKLSAIVRMQYKGQVTDLEIVSPKLMLESAADVDALVASFEQHYAEIYTLSAQFPEAGFVISGAAAVGSQRTTAPRLPQTARGSATPDRRALKSALLGKILGQGYTPASYNLLSYGGGGPLHVGNYSDALGFKDVLIPTWAAAFSAFGCTCAPHEYRFDRSTLL